MGKNSERQQFVELLFKQNYNRIYEYCFYKLGPSGQDAEDCAMEVFFRALGRAEHLMAHPCPERWLYRTARNVSLEYLRKKQKEWEFGEQMKEWLAERKWGEEEMGEDTEEAAARRLETYFLEGLSERERELYRLLVVEGRNTEEIAKACSISYTSVTSRVWRLRKKLKKRMNRLEGKEGRKR